MNRELIEKWVEALESGNYKQGQLTLRDEDNNFCCLGVLCDVSGIGEWELPELHYRYLYKVGEKEVGSAYIPESVKFLIDVKLDQDTLSDLNDIQKYSFGQIAQYIREKYLA